MPKQTREDSYDSSTCHNWDSNSGSYDPFHENPISLEDTKCSNYNNAYNIEEIKVSAEHNNERMGTAKENKDVIKNNTKVFKQTLTDSQKKSLRRKTQAAAP